MKIFLRHGRNNKLAIDFYKTKEGEVVEKPHNYFFALKSLAYKKISLCFLFPFVPITNLVEDNPAEERGLGIQGIGL